MRYGLFFKADDLDLTPLFSDYHLELAGLDGKVDNTDVNGLTSSGHNASGWAALAKSASASTTCHGHHGWPCAAA